MLIAIDPTMVHALALLIIAMTGLIKAIWPNGVRR
jgi:preprotein translocase subunit Sec61beta